MVILWLVLDFRQAWIRYPENGQINHPFPSQADWLGLNISGNGKHVAQSWPGEEFSHNTSHS